MGIRGNERLLITYHHSNPQIVIMGMVLDSAGVITIDWKTSHNVVFITKPTILGLHPEGVATGQTSQPICYHQEWIKDTNGAYTGMKVYSSGSGTTIHWAVQGIVQK